MNGAMNEKIDKIIRKYTISAFISEMVYESSKEYLRLLKSAV
jgi:hypothetical protein